MCKGMSSCASKTKPKKIIFLFLYREHPLRHLHRDYCVRSRRQSHTLLYVTPGEGSLGPSDRQEPSDTM
jgi:hypothetical protein